MSSHYGTPPRSPRNEGAAVDVSMRLMSILTPPRLTRSTSASAGGARQDTEIVFVGDSNNDELHDEESLSSVEQSEANDCCICLEEMVAIDIATIDGCNHQFCTSCVMHWSETSNTCPLCRARFTSYESAEGVVRVPDRLPAVALELVGLFNLEDVTLEEVRVLYQDETETLEQIRLYLERTTRLREDIRNEAELLTETLELCHLLASILETGSFARLEEIQTQLEQNMETAVDPLYIHSYEVRLMEVRFIASIMRSEPSPELLAEVQANNERCVELSRQLIEVSRQHMVRIEQRIEELELRIERQERYVSRIEQIIANLAEE